MNPILKASEIAVFLSEPLIGEDLDVTGIASIDDVKDGQLSFIRNAAYKERIEIRALLIVCLDKEIDPNSKSSYIRTENPRLAFAKVAARYFEPHQSPGIAETARIGQNVHIGKNVRIGEYCVIGNNVSIGDESALGHGVVVSDNCTMGRHCRIKSNTVIGEEGFGYEFEDRIPVRVPQLGSVRIGEHVEIGANCLIVRGTIKDTVIEDHVKIDAQVHIAHNCRIGRNTIITAEAEISGSVSIGENCWLAPNCSIVQKVEIGNNVTVGIGAVVLKSIPDNQKVMGLEAIELWQLLKYKKQTCFPPK